MEGDAGASRLNPPPMSSDRRLRRLARRPGRRNRQESAAEADQVSPEEATGDLATPEEETGSEVKTGDSEDTGDETAAPETDAAETDAAETDAAETDEPDAAEADAADAEEARPEWRPSRLGRAWVAAVAAVLVLAAGGIGVGGYLALRVHHESEAIARNDAAALKAAVECVSATQAPDINAMLASEQKIIDCGTDAYRSQALLYTGPLVEAYQAANIHVQVSDVRAAVERNNKDGSVDVLVALRVKVASDKSENETGYRLRVRMLPTEGQYKISRLDQVTK